MQPYVALRPTWCVVVDVSAKLSEVHEITPQSDYVIIFNDGYCEWMPRYDLTTTHCSIDITWFPFDTQRCAVILESWIMSADQFNITLPFYPGAFMEYIPSDEWSISCAYSSTAYYFLSKMF